MCSLWRSVAIAIPAGSRSSRKSWVSWGQLVGLDLQVSQGQSILCLWSALFEKRKSQCWCFWDAVWAQVAVSQWAWKGGDSHCAAVDVLHVLALSRSENSGFPRSQAFTCTDGDICLAGAGQDTAQKISSGKWRHRWALWEGNAFFPRVIPGSRFALSLLWALYELVWNPWSPWTCRSYVAMRAGGHRSYRPRVQEHGRDQPHAGSVNEWASSTCEVDVSTCGFLHLWVSLWGLVQFFFHFLIFFFFTKSWVAAASQMRSLRRTIWDQYQVA